MPLAYSSHRSDGVHHHSNQSSSKSYIPKPKKSQDWVTTRERLVKHQQQVQQEQDELEMQHRLDTGRRLPFGWRQVKDSYGRQYFSHDASGRSCWMEPFVVQVPWEFRYVVNNMSHLLWSESDTQWVRITLESEEDRTKLFSGLYHLVLDKILREPKYLSGSVGPNGCDEHGNVNLPTLAECSKRCKQLGVPENKYSLFIERTLRHKPWNDGQESNSRPSTPGTPKRSRSRSRSKERRGSGRLRSPMSASMSPSSARSRSRSRSRSRPGTQESMYHNHHQSIEHFQHEKAHVRSRSASAKKGSRRTSQPPRIARSASPIKKKMPAQKPFPENPIPKGSLTMAEFGSLQAKIYREKKLQELYKAEKMKRNLQAHFGRLETSHYDTAEYFEEATENEDGNRTRLPSISLVVGTAVPHPPGRTETIEIIGDDDEFSASYEGGDSDDEAHPSVSKSDLREILEVTDFEKTLAQVNLVREELLKLQRQANLGQKEKSIDLERKDQKPASTLLVVAATAKEGGAEEREEEGEETQIVSPLGEALEAFLHDDEEGDSSIDDGELSFSKEEPSFLNPEGATYEKEQQQQAREQMMIVKELQRKLDISEDARKAALGEVDRLKLALGKLREKHESYQTDKAGELIRAEQRERDFASKVEFLQQSNEHLKREIERLKQQAQDGQSDLTSADLRKTLDQLAESQESLSMANQSRLSAERRAKETSERVAKLTHLLAQAQAKNETDRVERDSAITELETLKNTFQKLNQSRDELLDELQMTRESHFAELEGERVERAALNREITDLKAKLFELRISGSSSSAPPSSVKNSKIESEGSLEELKMEDNDQKISDADDSSSKLGNEDDIENTKFTIEHQSNRIVELEKELFDAKCSLSRLTQRLKQSENDVASLRSELKNAKESAVATKETCDARIKSLTAQKGQRDVEIRQLSLRLQERDAALEDAVQELGNKSMYLEKLNGELETLERARNRAEEDSVVLKRDMAQELAMKQQQMEEYRAGLEQHYTKCKKIWEKEHEEEIDTLKKLQHDELQSVISKSKMECRIALEAQRERFTSQIKEMEDTIEQRVKILQSTHEQEVASREERLRREMRESFDEALQQERTRSQTLLNESYLQREVSMVNTKRRDALVYLNKTVESSRRQKLALAFGQWNRYSHGQRSEELMEVYSAAMDQTNAVAKLLVICAKIKMQQTRSAFSHWASITVNSNKIGYHHNNHHGSNIRGTPSSPPPPPPPLPSQNHYYTYSMYPNELARKIRRKLPQQTYLTHIHEFVQDLPVNIEGKIPPQVFHDALVSISLDIAHGYKCSNETIHWNRTAQETKRDNQLKDRHEFHVRLCTIYLGQDFAKTYDKPRETITSSFELQPGKDWIILTTGALTKLAFWTERHQLTAKARAWAKWLAVAASTDNKSGGGKGGGTSDFIRSMETQALQEEVRALHAQLGASKAEAWKYKRKLLSQYLQNEP